MVKMSLKSKVQSLRSKLVHSMQSQRDCALQPRFARNELPWENEFDEYNPERVAITRRIPLGPWGCRAFSIFPRVARKLATLGLEDAIPLGLKNTCKQHSKNARANLLECDRGPRANCHGPRDNNPGPNRLYRSLVALQNPRGGFFQSVNRLSFYRQVSLFPRFEATLHLHYWIAFLRELPRCRRR